VLEKHPHYCVRDKMFNCHEQIEINRDLENEFKTEIFFRNAMYCRENVVLQWTYIY